ncbi:MAG: DNA repair protein RecO [Phycisphaerae bacterium]
MAAQTDPGFVLKLTEYSETSQITWLLTRRFGVLRLLGKGLRRGTKTRVAVGLDLLELGDATFIAAREAGSLGTLTEWVQRDSFIGLRAEMLTLYAGLYAAELSIALTEPDDPHAELFDAFGALLRELSAMPAGAPPPPHANRWPALVRFQLDILQAAGFSPELDRCVDCSRAPATGSRIHFSARAGGLVCRDCEMHHPEKRGVPRVMLAEGVAKHPAAWFVLLDYYITHLANRRMNSAPVLDTLAKKPDRPAI